MSSTSFVTRRVDNIIKSTGDKRKYRGLKLSNGLKVLLISDVKTDMSAAALVVEAGRLMDPWELPGLAQLCERMICLSSDKYPSENDFAKLVSSHGGSFMAYTANDHTNYHFDIKSEHLSSGLDRFVQFFLSPLFPEESIENEVIYIDSEYLKNLNNDASRIDGIEKFLSKPGHDYGKLGWGNKASIFEDSRLKVNELRDSLLKFYNEWYSSNIMTLCIIGKESLDELEGYLGNLKFDAIKNKNIKKKIWTHPYGKEQLCKRIEIVPAEDSCSLNILFPIDDMLKEYRTNPNYPIGYLIGHEGRGSLFSEWKRLGWIDRLSSGSDTVVDGIANFCIKINLTLDGLEHTEDIIDMVFQYIGLVKRDYKEVLPWLLEETQNLNSIRFINRGEDTPLDNARGIARSLRRYPLEDILCCPYLLDYFDNDLILKQLNHLHPDNMIYQVVSQSFAGNEGNIKEKLYGTEMRILPIDEMTRQRYIDAMKTSINPRMKLAERNEFEYKTSNLKE